MSSGSVEVDPDVELGHLPSPHPLTLSSHGFPLPIGSNSCHLYSCARAPHPSSLAAAAGKSTTMDLSLEARSRKDKGYLVAGVFPKNGVIPTEKIVWVREIEDLFRSLRAEEKQLRSFWRRWFGLKEVRGMGLYKASLNVIPCQLKMVQTAIKLIS